MHEGPTQNKITRLGNILVAFAIASDGLESRTALQVKTEDFAKKKVKTEDSEIAQKVVGLYRKNVYQAEVLLL
jgi:hypothetical protein